MGIAKFNKVNNLFKHDTAGYKFFSLKDLFATSKESGATYMLRGLYINPKGKFGASPFAATDGFFISLPSHLLDTVRDIMGDAETVKLINDGKCALTIRPYEADDGSEHYSVDFIDV